MKKICVECLVDKDEEEYYQRKGKSYRYRRCRKCCNEIAIKKMLEWRIKNREKYNAYQRAYRAKIKKQRHATSK